jgi:glutaconate CoA-transferase subunit A
VGTDLTPHTTVKFIDCPFTGEKLAAVKAIRPDVSIIHAQKADKAGNVLLWGIVGAQKEAIMAADRSIVTVEEIVDKLDAPPNAVILPTWVVSAVAQVKCGAFPSYTHGYYPRSNAFYKQWDGISKDRDTFTAWIDKYIMNTKNFDEFRALLEKA